MNTTPAQVRKALQRRHPSLDIVKTQGSWYVVGDGTEMWVERCLFTSSFYGQSAPWWLNIIEEMMPKK